ncbi:hypothetical protein [Thalassolituus oleivorans]|uniref:hypothetical protein n=1 Tax=Thalassolituus oleivorans TaxID=187493 RepID=UPI0023F20AF8|nr:hypothetical protein [Thalassolituus oleivorans]
MDPKISIESIWEDESVFEVKFQASSGGFAGIANCYTNRESIAELASSIEGFPKSIDQEVNFSSGESDNLSYFSLRFRCIDRSGHVSVRVKVAHIVTYTNKQKEFNVSEFDLAVEPAAVDLFSRSLETLSKAKLHEVKAELRGKT